MAWLSGWSYRKAIVIAHTADGAQTNYQIKLLVGESSGATGEDVDCGGKVASDFDDLRFTTSDGSTLCDYWIESLSGSTPNQLATVWIEVPSIAAHPDDTTIYMYYDGTETAASNGTNTFIIFNDGTITTGWTDVTLAGSGCTWSSSGGKIRAVADAALSSAAFYCDTQTGTNNYRVECKITAQDGLAAGNYQQGIKHHTTQSNADAGYARWLDLSTINKFSVKGTAESQSSADTGYDASVEHKYTFIKNGTAWNLLIDGVSKVTHTETFNSQYVGVWACMYDASGSGRWVDFDDFRVSRFTTTQPTWSSFGAEESFYLNRLSPYVHILAH